MSAGLKNAIARGAKAALWLMTLVGCFIVAMALANTYLLATGSKAGALIAPEDLAPIIPDAIGSGAYGVALIAISTILRNAVGRWQRAPHPRNTEADRGTLWRAVLAFFALPGVVAFAVPLALADRTAGIGFMRALGLLPVAAGTLLLLACVREFYVAGRGTLAPWSPPKSLVVTGPYARSRNPMYVAVATVLVGWAVVFGSTSLSIYALLVTVAFNLRVRLAEEPWAARRFGEEWIAYRARTPRWLF